MSDNDFSSRSGPSLLEEDSKPANLLNSKTAIETNCVLAPQSENSEDAESAPIELLSEFLSAVMSRNYGAALKYCKIILCYEPENEIVQEFYPLIEARLKKIEFESDCSSEDEGTDYEDDISSTTNTSDFQDTELIEDTNKSISSEEDNGWTTALNTDSDSTEKDEKDDNANSCSFNCLFQNVEATDICDNKIFNVTS